MTTETTYHVQRNGQFASDPYEDTVEGRENAIQWTADIGHATIYPRARALTLAAALCARAVMRTRGGRLCFITSK